MAIPRPSKASTPVAMLVITVGVAVVLVVVVGGLWLLLSGTTKHSSVSIPPADRCAATAGDYSGIVTPEQAGNAAIIVGESIRRGLPARAATVALVTAWQESGLRNLDHGDLDSVGLFQQRPSQGWGTIDQIIDPWYASGKFYDALVKLPHWQSDPINDVAQAVQKSGYPDAYAQHESSGRAFASTMTGQTIAGLACIANTGPGGGGDELTALLQKVWGDKLKIEQTDLTMSITAPDAATAWSVAQLSMMQLEAYGMTSVQVGDELWQHSATGLSTWAQIGTATPSGIASPGGTPSPAGPPAGNVAVLTLR